MSAITTIGIQRLTTGERVAIILTDGRVGAEAEALEFAERLMGCTPHLAFRNSKHGELELTFTDRPAPDLP